MEEGSMNSNWIRQLATALLAAITLAAWAQASLAKEDPKARLAKAEAMFAERCKKAGVFIHRTAENVEGIFLMKLRPQTASTMGISIGWMIRMGMTGRGDRYIKSFPARLRDKRWLADINETVASKGYRYVEAIDEKDGKRYRYTGS
jgi:hypothetical protein